MDKETALTILKSNVDLHQKYYSAFNLSSFPFQGEVKENKFKIIRNINYHNGFLPIIKGEIKSGLDGSTVYIKMVLPLFTTLFMFSFLLVIFWNDIFHFSGWDG
ncbi:MAG: hypothetical protein ACLFPF_05210 [Halanaerobiales bacterium]